MSEDAVTSVIVILSIVLFANLITHALTMRRNFSLIVKHAHEIQKLECQVARASNARDHLEQYANKLELRCMTIKSRLDDIGLLAINGEQNDEVTP